MKWSYSPSCCKETSCIFNEGLLVPEGTPGKTVQEPLPPCASDERGPKEGFCKKHVGFSLQGICTRNFAPILIWAFYNFAMALWNVWGFLYPS